MLCNMTCCFLCTIRHKTLIFFSLIIRTGLTLQYWNNSNWRGDDDIVHSIGSLEEEIKLAVGTRSQNDRLVRCAESYNPDKRKKKCFFQVSKCHERLGCVCVCVRQCVCVWDVSRTTHDGGHLDKSVNFTATYTASWRRLITFMGGSSCQPPRLYYKWESHSQLDKLANGDKKKQKTDRCVHVWRGEHENRGRRWSLFSCLGNGVSFSRPTNILN